MIRTTRNPILGSASFWTQDLSIIGFKTKTLSELVSDMFKNGEQGFFYDPSSLTYGTYEVDQTSVGVPVTVGVADAAEYDNTLHTGMVYRADQYNQSIVNFDVDNIKSHELVIENTGASTIAVNADLAMGTVLFTVAAGQRVTRIIAPVQVIVITSANDVSTAYFKIHSLKEFSGQYIMYQDEAGTIPVTGAGQPVGLILDKSKGTALSAEKVINSGFDSDTAWIKAATVTISNGNAILNNAGGNPVLSQNIVLVPNAWYDVTVVVPEVSAGAMLFRIYGTGGSDTIFNISAAGTYKTRIKARSDATGLIGFSASSTSAKIDRVSIRELAGNHAYNTASAQRPLLRDAPRRIDYDVSDDKLITNLPAQLIGATLIRSVPNVGTQILTNQTIPTPYNDNTDHCGLIVINRTLTTTETYLITQLFNKAAGV